MPYKVLIRKLWNQISKEAEVEIENRERNDMLAMLAIKRVIQDRDVDVLDKICEKSWAAWLGLQVKFI